ncbi:MAG: putative zinc-binding metallopeptidase [Acidimicrobiia bacterium]
MDALSCPVCGHAVYFDNLACVACGAALVFDVGADAFVADAVPCANRATVEGCNWAAAGDDGWCRSCRLDIDHGPTEARARFQEAKRRALRQLVGFGVDLDRPPVLRFDLRAGSPEAPVTIGHDDGLITLDTAEADPSHLEAVRTSLGEPYRSPLGHVRHELGHWYWAAHVGVTFDLVEFRAAFGDETVPYAEALERHYATPDDGSWAAEHVSHYAAAHPWEDHAESFAHLLHITGTLGTARTHGLVHWAGPIAALDLRFLYERWIELSVALNELNRSMGLPDAYPFAPSPRTVEKLELIWRHLVGAGRAATA